MQKFILNSSNFLQIIPKIGIYLRSLKYDKSMQVIIKFYKKDKTAEQRSFWHILLGILSDETGYTVGEVKELIKKSELGTKEVMIGNVSHTVTESSEKANRETYSKLIETTYRVGAEAGIALPNPRYIER